MFRRSRFTGRRVAAVIAAMNSCVAAACGASSETQAARQTSGAAAEDAPAGSATVAMGVGGSHAAQGATGRPQSNGAGASPTAYDEVSCSSDDCPCATDEECGAAVYPVCQPRECGSTPVCRYGADNASPGLTLLVCGCDGIVTSRNTSSPWPALYAYAIEPYGPNPCNCEGDQVCERSRCVDQPCDASVDASPRMDAVAVGEALPWDDGVLVRALSSYTLYGDAIVQGGQLQMDLDEDVNGGNTYFLVDVDENGECTPGEVTLPFAITLNVAERMWLYTLLTDVEARPCEDAGL